MSDGAPMAKSLTAEWCMKDQGGKVTVDTWNDVQSLLRRISAMSTPTLLLLYDPDSGAELGVGLGREKTVFTYQSTVRPPYFISQGERDAQGVTWFWYGGEGTEYLNSNLVSARFVDATVRAFVSTLSRPDTIEWEAL
jgi:hypothetical protein